MSNYWTSRAARRGPLLLAALLGAAVLPRLAAAQTLFNGSGGLVFVQDSVLYVRGDATGKAFENQGAFEFSAAPGNRPRLFVDEGDLLNTGAATWVAGLSTVVLNGASGTTRTLTPGAALFNNLRIDNPAAGANAGGVVLGSSGQVAGTLRMANGFLNTTTAYQLRLSATATVFGEVNTSYVKGSLVQQQLVPATATPVDFGNIGFVINPQNQAFRLEVDRRAGLNVLNYSYGRNPIASPVFEGIDRIWRLTSSVSPVATATNITLSWLSADDRSNNFAASQAQVWRSIDQGASWQAVLGSTQNGSGHTVSFTATILTAWYTVSTRANPLPVQLTAFTATAQQLDANLAWTTASEVNSNYFVVQRSLNGQTWTDVRQQPAAGNSSRPRNYTEVDAGAGRLGSLLYYRLHQVDTDGTGTYSPVRTVQFAPAVLGFALDAYPVPLQAWLTLDVRLPGTEPFQVELYDASGRVILRRSWDSPAATARYQLDVSSLASGTYILRAHQGEAQASRRLVKE